MLQTDRAGQGSYLKLARWENMIASAMYQVYHLLLVLTHLFPPLRFRN